MFAQIAENMTKMVKFCIFKYFNYFDNFVFSGSNHVVLMGNPNTLSYSVILMPGVNELSFLVETCKRNVGLSLGQNLLIGQ